MSKNESCSIFTKFGAHVSKYKKTWFQEKKLLNWLMCANCGRSKVPNVVQKCQKMKVVRSSQKLAYNYSSTRRLGFERNMLKSAHLCHLWPIKSAKMWCRSAKDEICLIFTKFGIQLLKYKTKWFQEEKF